jgi:hypothetical protein
MLVESGVYVLGALSPAERQSYERHLTTCAECRAEVGELAVLPGLLGRLDDVSVETEAATVSAPPSILPAVMMRVRQRRRSRRYIAIAGGIAAACLALIVGLTAPNQVNPRPPAQAAPTASAVAMHAMKPVDGAQVATASIGVTSFSGGTRITGTCTYNSSGNSYPGLVAFALVAYPKQGKPQPLSSWSAWPGETQPFSASTWQPMSDLSHIDLVGPNGETVLTYQIA